MHDDNFTTDTSVGATSSVWPPGWLEQIAAVPWTQLDSSELAQAALSILASHDLPGMFVLSFEDGVRIRSSMGEVELPLADPFPSLLFRIHRSQGARFRLLPSDWLRCDTHPLVRGWLEPCGQVQVFAVETEVVPAFLLVSSIAPEPEPIEHAVQLLARHIQIALDRARDRTTIERMSAELETMTTRLLHVAEMALTDQTVNAVAHQINNCLTSVMGYSQLLLEIGLRNDEETGYMRRVFTEAERMSRAVENLLSFLRRRQFEPELLDLNELVQQAAALQSYELEKLDIALRFDLDPDLPLTFGDAYSMEVVFLNLLMNAHQAIADRNTPGRITIRTQLLPVADGRIAVEFDDNGPGISKELLHNVFDSFFSTKSTRRHVGLGLTVARRLVQEHQGSLTVNSETGEGTIVRIELPIRNGPEAEAPRAHILIIDDEEDVVTILSRLLESRNYRATVVYSAEEALDRITELNFDCILADLKMPGMGGQEFFESIRETRPDLAARFVFVTADNGRPEVAEFLAASGAPWVQKPFDLAHLIRIVQQVIAATASR